MSKSDPPLVRKSDKECMVLAACDQFWVSMSTLSSSSWSPRSDLVTLGGGQIIPSPTRELEFGMFLPKSLPFQPAHINFLSWCRLLVGCDAIQLESWRVIGLLFVIISQLAEVSLCKSLGRWCLSTQQERLPSRLRKTNQKSGCIAELRSCSLVLWPKGTFALLSSRWSNEFASKPIAFRIQELERATQSGGSPIKD